MAEHNHLKRVIFLQVQLPATSSEGDWLRNVAEKMGSLYLGIFIRANQLRTVALNVGLLQPCAMSFEHCNKMCG